MGKINIIRIKNGFFAEFALICEIVKRTYGVLAEKYDYRHIYEFLKNRGIEVKIESNGVLDDISTENK